MPSGVSVSATGPRGSLGCSSPASRALLASIAHTLPKAPRPRLARRPQDGAHRFAPPPDVIAQPSVQRCPFDRQRRSPRNGAREERSLLGGLRGRALPTWRPTGGGILPADWLDAVWSRPPRAIGRGLRNVSTDWSSGRARRSVIGRVVRSARRPRRKVGGALLRGGPPDESEAAEQARRRALERTRR